MEHPPTPQPEEHLVEELTESIQQLEDRLEKINTPQRNFFMGMLSGFGGAIGATLLVTLLITIFTWLSYKTERFPKIHNFIGGITSEIKK